MLNWITRSSFFRDFHLWWKGVPDFYRSMAIGLLVILGMNAVSNMPFFKDREDKSFDWMTGMHRGVLSRHALNYRPIIFIDIDERSFRHWGEPFFIPRDKLQRLIQYAVDGGAALVIVDIELSQTAHNADHALREYLANFATGMHKPPEVFLARGLRQPLDSNKGIIEQRSSFLDGVPDTNPHVHWAAPLFEQDEDSNIRRWRLWEEVCAVDSFQGRSQRVALPSFQLLTAAALSAPDGINHLKRELHSKVQQRSDCKDSSTKFDDLGIYEYKSLRFRFNEGDLERRIRYRFPWRLNEGERYPGIAWANEQDHPVFEIKPAVLITDAPVVSKDDVAGNIIIIGASYADSRDVFATPLEKMPGAMIIANSISSFVTSGEVSYVPWMKFFLQAFIVMAVAWTFSRIKRYMKSGIWRRMAKYICIAIALAALLPLSFFLDDWGVWLDVGIPILFIEWFSSAFDQHEKLTREFNS